MAPKESQNSKSHLNPRATERLRVVDEYTNGILQELKKISAKPSRLRTTDENWKLSLDEVERIREEKEEREVSKELENIGNILETGNGNTAKLPGLIDLCIPSITLCMGVFSCSSEKIRQELETVVELSHSVQEIVAPITGFLNPENVDSIQTVIREVNLQLQLMTNTLKDLSFVNNILPASPTITVQPSSANIINSVEPCQPVINVQPPDIPIINEFKPNNQITNNFKPPDLPITNEFKPNNQITNNFDPKNSFAPINNFAPVNNITVECGGITPPEPTPEYDYYQVANINNVESYSTAPSQTYRYMLYSLLAYFAIPSSDPDEVLVADYIKYASSVELQSRGFPHRLDDLGTGFNSASMIRDGVGFISYYYGKDDVIVGAAYIAQNGSNSENFKIPEYVSTKVYIRRNYSKIDS